MILYNPHVDDFLAEPPHFRFLKRRPLKKYGFLIQNILERGEQIPIVVDGTISAFIPEVIFSRIPRFVRQFISNWEFKIWITVNDLANNVSLIPADALSSRDVLLAFSYKSATGKFGLRKPIFDKCGHVVFHLSHYFIATKEKSKNLSSLTNVILAGDSDISENPYFKNTFNWYHKPFLVLPFAVSMRFNVNTSWEDREPKAVATGSFHNLTKEIPRRKYEDFMRATGSDTYHPLRKQIYLSRHNLQYIKCHVSPYRPESEQSVISKIVAHFSVAQKSYFSVDLVTLYNKYRYAVVGEELSGFPALGAFEALACGCVLIGDSACYAGTGIEPDEHYIPHSGDIESIRVAVESAKRPDPVSVQVALRKMTPNAVFLRWVTTLEKSYLDDLRCV